MTRKKIIAIVALFFLVGFLVAGYSANRFRQYTAKVTVEVAPTGSSLTLNGRSSKSGALRVKPGEYKISASKKGFATVTKDVNASKDRIQYVGIVLLPD